MVDLYSGDKKAEQITYDIPVDFLSFVRFFSWKILVVREVRSDDVELVSYNALFNVF